MVSKKRGQLAKKEIDVFLEQREFQQNLKRQRHAHKIEAYAPDLDLIERRKQRRGKYIIVDGLDGIGKGTILRTLKEYEERLGKAVFDTVAHSKAWEELPGIEIIWSPPRPHYNTILTAEPTYVGIGKVIREEVTGINERHYTSEDEIIAYGLDRLVHMRKLVIPCLINDITVISSRGIAASLTYQSRRASEEKRDQKKIREMILNQGGNKLQLEYAPDLLIIPTIQNIKEIIKRIESRKDYEKDDKVIFEDLNFQSRLKPLYESSWLRKIFTARGTKVAYLDAGKSVEETRKQTIEIYKTFIEYEEIPDKYKCPLFN